MDRTTAATVEKPSPRFTIKVDGEDRDIFMSFALVNRLQFLVGDVEGLPLVMIDPTMRDAIMKELLAVRTKSGKLVDEVDPETVEVSLSDITNILDWASAHILDFFLAGLERAQALQFRNQARLSNLKSTQAGSPA